MEYDPNIHHRRSIRLKGFDYSSPLWYFVTICVQGKAHLLGDVVDGEMHLNEAGQIVQNAWQILPERFPDISLDEHVVMPNHFHGIINLVGAELAPPQGTASCAPALPAVVQAFKSISAITVNTLLTHQGQPFWQRNYYEHIIRNEREPTMIRDYIRTNPQRWGFDRENPMSTEPDPELWT